MTEAGVRLIAIRMDGSGRKVRCGGQGHSHRGGDI